MGFTIEDACSLIGKLLSVDLALVCIAVIPEMVGIGERQGVAKNLPSGAIFLGTIDPCDLHQGLHSFLAGLIGSAVFWIVPWGISVVLFSPDVLVGEDFVDVHPSSFITWKAVTISTRSFLTSCADLMTKDLVELSNGICCL